VNARPVRDQSHAATILSPPGTSNAFAFTNVLRMKNLAEQVAAEVRAHRARHNRTTNDLAAHLGLSHSAVRRRLTGQIPLTLTEVDTIATWLNVSPSALLEEPCPTTPTS
jgi:antitoxin component HigA of HigAB toxin-antitoxin module